MKALNEVPLRTIFTQYGREIAPELLKVVLDPVVFLLRFMPMGAPVGLSHVE